LIGTKEETKKFVMSLEGVTQDPDLLQDDDIQIQDPGLLEEEDQNHVQETKIQNLIFFEGAGQILFK